MSVGYMKMTNNFTKEEYLMFDQKFDFYDKTTLKSYNLDVTMRYQLTMLDSLDPFTRIHSENVASITCRLCEYLRCDKNFTAYCTICAYLHDIGKMFIPAKILNKPDKLTDEEFAIMKTHTLIGYKMCMDDIKLRPYALGPKYHHETLDGMGYPEGLVGNLIPYEDQIIKVADDYDALVTKRQYKTHIHISDTLKDLIKDTEPNIKVAALDNAAQGVKLGKLNKKVVKALFKVVIDDTYYEISCVTGYVDYLKDQIKRIEQILEYEEKMDKAHSEKKKNYYEIIAGERRWRAAKLAGIKEVPIIVKDYTDQEIVEISLIENIQRENLNPIEEAMAFKRLLQEFQLKQDEVAERVSKSRTAVTNSMRLLKLSPRVQQMIIDDMISTGHARALLAIDDEEQQFILANKIFDEKLSVRETEKLVKALKNPKKEVKKEKPEHTFIYENIEEQIKNIMGTKVSVNQKANGKGKIEIEYYSEEELERIYDLLMTIPRGE